MLVRFTSAYNTSFKGYFDINGFHGVIADPCRNAGVKNEGVVKPLRCVLCMPVDKCIWEYETIWEMGIVKCIGKGKHYFITIANNNT